jgi:type I restriction enzyme S subunit
MLIQLRHIFKVVSGSTPESGKGFYWDGDIPWVTPEDVTQLSKGYKIWDTNRKITEEGFQNTGVTMAPRNSIVLTKRAPIGHLAISSIEACCNQGCFLLVPKGEIIPEFYYYFLLANKHLLQSLGRGSTFMELSLDDLKSFKIPKNSIQEQNKIVYSLESEVNRTDSLITAKELLVKKLSEKLQALIVHAVTKGLTSKTETRNTDIKGLDKIPKHWVVKKFKHITSKIGSGVTPRGGSEVYQRDGIPLLRSQNIYSDGLRLDDVAYISEEIHQSMTNSKVQKGDVLLNITGASLGRCYYFDEEYEEANVNQHVCILRPNNYVLTKYLHYFLVSSVGQNQIAINEVGGGREGLNFDSIKSFFIPLPPKEEQAEIVFYLEAEVKKIYALQEATEKSIALLIERRESLIYEAVTGH